MDKYCKTMKHIPCLAFVREFRAHDTEMTPELLPQREMTNCVNYNKCQLLKLFIARTVIGWLYTVEWRPCKTVLCKYKRTLFTIPETVSYNSFVDQLIYEYR